MLSRDGANNEGEAGGRARTFDLLPAIDLRGGRVVRLRQGDFGQETIYADDPGVVAAGFAAAGARWIHVVDLDGARDGERRQSAAVARIVEAAGLAVACEVAGGLRDERAVEQVLAAGAARAVVGTAALRDPDLVARLVAAFGAARIAIALDVREGLAVGHGWVPGAPGIPVGEALGALANRGAVRFEVTAIERDGLLEGPNLSLLRACVALGRGAVIASAGVASLADLDAVRELGCGGAIVGRAIYEGRLDLAEAALRFG
jgi:phosphoribosylformimino-5-aminoimidazole carboxamide ribotide isomerase